VPHQQRKEAIHIGAGGPPASQLQRIITYPAGPERNSAVSLSNSGKTIGNCFLHRNAQLAPGMLTQNFAAVGVIEGKNKTAHAVLDVG
jgi:hypothetical protein